MNLPACPVETTLMLIGDKWKVLILRELLEGTGAIRVHGGGFAGTIQAFGPEEKLASFQTGMEKLLGAGRCHILHIRPQGGCVVLD